MWHFAAPGKIVICYANSFYWRLKSGKNNDAYFWTGTEKEIKEILVDKGFLRQALKKKTAAHLWPYKSL